MLQAGAVKGLISAHFPRFKAKLAFPLRFPFNADVENFASHESEWEVGSETASGDREPIGEWKLAPCQGHLYRLP